MELHGAWCRGCRGVNIQGHLQLVLDQKGGGQGVRAVNIVPLPQQPQSLKYQQYRLSCVEKTAMGLAECLWLIVFPYYSKQIKSVPVCHPFIY